MPERAAVLNGLAVVRGVLAKAAVMTAESCLRLGADFGAIETPPRTWASHGRA